MPALLYITFVFAIRMMLICYVGVHVHNCRPTCYAMQAQSR